MQQRLDRPGYAKAAPQIYRDLLTDRRFPEGFLVGVGGRMDALRTLLPQTR